MWIWVIVGIGLSLIAVCEYYTWRTGVPTVTSLPSMRKKMIALIREEAAKRGKDAPFVIYDLGSGTGKLALEIGRALPSAQVRGIELSIVPYLLSQARRVLWKSNNVTFMRQSFWDLDLSSADVVVVYINANIRDSMGKKLNRELLSGALVLSNETELPEWGAPQRHPAGLLKLNVLAYRKA